MARFKRVVCLLAVAGAAILLGVKYQSLARLRAENGSLRQQLEPMTQLAAENERLSNIVAQADSPAANKQLSELLRLRGEVTLLRQQTNELQWLRAQNEQLKSALNNNVPVSSATNSPPARTPLAVYPRSAWAFAGYATPEAAFQSLNWAAATGNLDSFLANLTPDAQKDLAKEFEKKSVDEVTDLLSNKINLNTEVSILSKTETSENRVELEIVGSAEGMNHADKLIFEKIDGQWKFAPTDVAKPAQP